MKFHFLIIIGFFAICSCNQTTKSSDNKKGITSDTIYIGKNRKYSCPSEYFSSISQPNRIVRIDSGIYEFNNAIYITDSNVILEGLGSVKLIVRSATENVITIGQNNITLRNLHLSHETPPLGISCVGNVIMHDYGKNLIVDSCVLNGCGASGIYFNGGADKVIIKNSHIYNNSIGAIVHSNGEVWQKELEKNKFITSQNNIVELNGLELYRGRELRKIVDSLGFLTLPCTISYDSSFNKYYRLLPNETFQDIRYMDKPNTQLLSDFLRGYDNYIWGVLPDTTNYIGFIYSSVAAYNNFNIITFSKKADKISDYQLTEAQGDLQETSRTEFFTINNDLEIFHYRKKTREEPAIDLNGNEDYVQECIINEFYAEIDSNGLISAIEEKEFVCDENASH